MRACPGCGLLAKARRRWTTLEWLYEVDCVRCGLIRTTSEPKVAR